jgi:hypothetical protein
MQGFGDGRSVNKNESPTNYKRKPHHRKFDNGVSVPRARVELARPNGHQILSLACLPISAPGHFKLLELLFSSLKMKDHVQT